MGSWDETCMASQLPIRVGDPVRAVLLTDVRYADETYAGGFCYASDLWAPRCVPLRGRYDDYGGIALADDPANALNASIVVAGFLEDLSEMTSRASRRMGEHAPPRKALTIEGLLRAAERGSLYVEQHPEVAGDDGGKEPRLVGYALIHEGIYAAMAEAHARRAPSSWYRAADPLFDMLRDAAAFTSLDAAVRHLSPRLWAEFDPPYVRGLGFYVEGLSRRIGVGDLSVDAPEVAALCVEADALRSFASWLAWSRKYWSPQAGKGSQNIDTGGQVALARAVIAHAEERARRDEEEDDARAETG